jgi:hypothetical protein
MEVGSFVFDVVSLAREEARSFDDHEIGLLELKRLMLQTLYIWRVA